MALPKSGPHFETLQGRPTPSQLGTGTPTPGRVLYGDGSWGELSAAGGGISDPAIKTSRDALLYVGGAWVAGRVDWAEVTGKPTSFTPASHSHPESDVTGLTADLAAKQASSEKGQASGYASLDSGTKVPVAQLPAGTTSAKGAVELATDGEAAANVVVQGSDARLSDARAPTAHVHPESEVTSLVADLAGKAPSSHTHAESDVTNLVTDLAAKQATAQKGAANGYASLDSGVLVPVAQLPAATTAAKGVVELATSGEAAAGVAVQGDDARLSDPRAPLGHHVNHTSPGGTDQFVVGDKLDGQARTNFLKAGVAVATLRGLNVIEGAGMALTLADAGNPAATERVDLTVTHRAGAPLSNKLRMIPNFVATNLTTLTVLVTNTSYFLYIGRVADTLSTLNILCRVATAAVTITWAEVGVFKGTPVGQGAVSLSRVGFTNVAATYNSTGLKKTAVTLSGVAGGDDLWVSFGSQATTPFQLRAGLADDIQSGVFQQFAGRISTMTVPSTSTLVAATLAVPWVMAEV